MASFLDSIGTWAKANPYALQALSSTLGNVGSGMVGHGNDTRDIMRGITGAVQRGQGAQGQMLLAQQGAAMDQAAIAKEQEAITAGVAHLRELGYDDYAAALESGQADPQAVWNQVMKDISARNNPNMANDGQPASVREWQYFSTLDPAQQSAYMRMKRAVPYLNLGTEFAQPDPANPGQLAGPAIPINNEQAAFDTSTGTGLGSANAENIAAFGSMASKLPGLQQVVAELGELADKATYTLSGKLWDDVMRETGQMPSEGALARAQYIAMVDNQVLPLLRDTFGAAFTVKEGETLRATLGDPNKHPEEKKAILEAFIAQKVRDVQAMQSRIPAAGNQLPPTGNGGTTSTGLSWSVSP